LFVYPKVPLTESSLNQSALTTYITNNYSGVISVPTGWTVATHCTADGVHLTSAGAALVASNALQYLPAN